MARKEKNPDISYPNQTIVPVELEREMKDSYLDYAMSVIIGRALPDVRDGLKPVHRRILYAMYEDGLTVEKAFRKSATTVGNVLGRYHPHGDASVYDALVRLAQDFSMRYKLVDGHGNFGSIDGDPAAAYRYTEARMSRLSGELLREIDKETVDLVPNFDETRKEPRVMPSRFPNLLVNGSMGIAVGMTTNIPPHNMRETIDATICLIRNPEAELDDLMEHIKGPDFPTRGIIMGYAGIRAAYSTGKGRVRVRARTEMEEFGQGRIRIIITELPYQVNKARLIENIADLVKDKRLDGISGLRDESDRDGMRVVIELKKDANPQVELNRLFSMTQMQTTFSIVMLALVNDQKQPKLLSLREVLDEYIAHQIQVITRRTEYDRRKAMERAHLLEGLMIAVDNIDEVIKILRESYDDADTRLMERFGLTQIQAQAILDMRLRRIQGLEREKIEAEYNDLQEKIAYYNLLLSDGEMLKDVLVTELTEIRDKYGDERQTEITWDEDEIDIEDLIDEEDCVYTLTHAGYIKRMPADTYRAQKRGGKGITAQTLREEDYVETLFAASTHDLILFFTSFGRVYSKKGYRIPEAGRTAKGTNIVNILQLQAGEKVSAMIHVDSLEKDDEFLVMVTKSGTTKRLRLSALKNIRTNGIRAIRIDEEDELIAVRRTDGEQNILIATRKGMAICFSEKDVRPTGRDAAGVRGIRLRQGDYCVGAARAREGGALLTVTENGYGKRTDILEYLRGDTGVPQNRGGVGLKNYNITGKTGDIADIKVVDDMDDVLVISDDGTIIRMAAADISTYSRGTQGVRLMRVADDTKVISIARTEPLDEEEADAETPVGDADLGIPPSTASVGDDAHIVPPSEPIEDVSPDQTNATDDETN